MGSIPGKKRRGEEREDRTGQDRALEEERSWPSSNREQMFSGSS